MKNNPIVRAWPVLPILVLFLLPSLAALMRTEHAIAIEGTIYQLFGIIVVVFSLDEKLKHFRGVSLLVSFKTWLVDLWRWIRSLLPGRKVVNIGVAGMSEHADTSFGRGSVSLQISHLPAQKQLDWLKQKVDELAVKIDTNDDKMQIKLKNLDSKINGIDGSISVKISEFDKKLGQFMTGSFKWELVGAVCLLVGAVFGTIPWWVVTLYR
jgi:hypothetical protein